MKDFINWSTGDTAPIWVRYPARLLWGIGLLLVALSITGSVFFIAYGLFLLAGAIGWTKTVSLLSITLLAYVTLAFLRFRKGGHVDAQ